MEPTTRIFLYHIQTECKKLCVEAVDDFHRTVIAIEESPDTPFSLEVQQNLPAWRQLLTARIMATIFPLLNETETQNELQKSWDLLPYAAVYEVICKKAENFKGAPASQLESPALKKFLNKLKSGSIKSIQQLQAKQRSRSNRIQPQTIGKAQEVCLKILAKTANPDISDTHKAGLIRDLEIIQCEILQSGNSKLDQLSMALKKSKTGVERIEGLMRSEQESALNQKIRIDAIAEKSAENRRAIVDLTREDLTRLKSSESEVSENLENTLLHLENLNTASTVLQTISQVTGAVGGIALITTGPAGLAIGVAGEAVGVLTHSISWIVKCMTIHYAAKKICYESRLNEINKQQKSLQSSLAKLQATV